ncbi:MAG: ATP-binding cassette domain-containing protein [Propionibacteriaceae bacterium]|nr:ATP-binding cassette domain-containing protein [Propionibacteriaceae bacterium]
MNTSAALIEAAGLRKTIPGGGTALRDGTCQISGGSFTAIVGASGSGKTTLLSLLGLLDHPSGGRYLFDNADVAKLTETEHNRLRGHRMGFVFQNSYLVADETVFENVALPLRVRGVTRSTRTRLVDAALVQVGLRGFQGKRAGQLSGGEKQRVAVARAIVGQPDVVLADEPTGALDATSSRHLVGLLRDIAQTGTAVVVVTHDPLVATIADHAIEIVDGVTNPMPASAPASPQRLGQNTPARTTTSSSLRPAGARLIRWVEEIASAALAPLSRPLRSGLVLLAYVLGVAALVGAIGLAESATGHIVQRLTDAESNQVQVNMPSLYDSPFLLDPTLPDGAAARASKLPGVTLAVPVRTYGSESNILSRLPGATTSSFSGRIYVTETSYLDSLGYHAAQGTTALLTNTWDGVVAVLGFAAANDLSVPQPGPGVQIWLGYQAVDVIGVLAPTGDPLVDETVFFSRAVDPYLTNVVDSYLLIRTAKGYAEPLAKALPLALAPANPGSVQVSITSQLASLQAGISSDLTGLLSILAWLILVLSALTASTTMFLSVQHRAPEIALRRAMGASRTSVWRIFTYEGILIGLAGGILGCAAGAGLVWFVASRDSWPVCIGLQTVFLGLAAGLVTGVLASTVPAIYAANRDPASILRTV